jgi:glycerol-3-phosphate dehydrogenase (NAD(P)+)
VRCAVIGAGAWGTALAHLAAGNGLDTTIWAYETDVATAINEGHENRRFLKGLPLAKALRATNDQSNAIAGADIVIYAPPSQHLRRIVAQGVGHLRDGVTLVVASKGIEHGSLALMTSVIREEAPGRPVVGISGPSFAAEVVAGQPTAIVAASKDIRAAEAVQAALSSSTFRVYTNSDIIGVELGGALKNVMAVATGIVEGVGLGYNSRAALITRGLHEMTRLGVVLGANPATFAGLAGIGDLVLTCTGSLSRNRAIGLEIGKGASLETALAGKETVAEGVATTVSALQLAIKHDVDMPIVEMVHRILFEGHAVQHAVREMMSRELRPEQDL